MLLPVLAAALFAASGAVPHGTPKVEKLHVTPEVTAVRPLLVEPHVISIAGEVPTSVRGGWTIDAEYDFFESEAGDGAVTITLDVWSPKGRPTTKHAEKFTKEVEVPDLREKPGTFEIIVKSRDGRELGRGTYEVAAFPSADAS